MRIKNFDGKIDRIYLDNNAFIISEYGTLANEQTDSTADVKYNQIKGKNMIGFFTDNELSRIRVEGNGQTLYWIASEEKDTTGENSKEDIGLNSAVCSNLEILIENNEIVGIRLLKQIDGSMMPTDELPSKQKLDDFHWYGEYRPLERDDVFTWKREEDTEPALAAPIESSLNRPESVEGQ